MDKPLVSIVIPTYKRIDLLPRAIESALNQTYPNIELIVSDDEEPSGATWQYLTELCQRDTRVRAVRNVGRHGQEHNTNLALTSAGGRWIKPLHDDDRLLPTCVERFMHYCAGRDNIALAACQFIIVEGNKRIEPRRNGLPPAQLILQKYVHLGMYLVDRVTGGPPTGLFINRRVIDAGGLMVIDSKFRYFADSRWIIEMLRHGDSAMINEALVEYHQGEHASLSSEFRERPDDMDVEVLEMRRIMRDAIPSEVNSPSLQTAEQMIIALRAMSQAGAGSFGGALRRALSAPRPWAWWYAIRTILRKRFPARFRETPREILKPVVDSDEGA